MVSRSQKNKVSQCRRHIKITWEALKKKHYVASQNRLNSPRRWCSFPNRPSPHTEGKEGPKKEAGHSRLRGDSSTRQGNLHRRLALGSCKMNRSPLLSTKVLRIYIEALMGLNHMNCPDGFSSTLLSQDCVLENGSHCGNSGWSVHSKAEEGMRHFQLSWSSPGSHLVVISS